MAKKPVSDQMELFENGGFKDQGKTKDPISKNPVPIGSIKKEVRDDIPANLSEGEFVFPADVVRYHGLEKIMGFRDQAKQGLQKMENMGQMGNSDQATLPDGIPFTQMAVGGLTPEIQSPVIQAPTVIPEQVPGVQYNPATQQTLRPSVYSYGTQMPKVEQDTVQQPTQPTVNIPTAIQYGAQARPAYRQPTNTAATPSFSKLIGADYGQLQESETKKYVNPETKEELYIPFVNGEPIYPIPTGFILAEDVKEEEAKEKAGEVKTTSVRQDNEGSDGYESTMDTSVTGGFYSDPQTFDYDLTDDELADLAAGRTPSTTTTRGVSMMDKAVMDFGQFGKGVLGAIGSMLGGTNEAKGISTSVQSDRLGSLGYNTDTSKNSLANSLGIDLNDKNTMALGHNPGNQNPNAKNEVYSKTGISVNVNPNSLGYLSSSGYTNRSSFANAMSVAMNTGFAGTLGPNINAAVYSQDRLSLENKARSALGVPSLDVDKAVAQLSGITNNFGGKPGFGAMVSYNSNGNATGVSLGSYSYNSNGTINSFQTIDPTTGMNTNVMSNVHNGYDKNGNGKGFTIGNFNTKDPTVGKGKTTTTSKGTTTATVTDPNVDKVTANEFSNVAPPTTVDYGNDAQSTTTSPGDVDDVTSPESPFGYSGPSTDISSPTDDSNTSNTSTNSPTDNSNNTNTTDSDSGGTSDGNDSSKIVCTTMNKMYGLPMYSNKVWMRYNKYKKLDSAWQLGYHKIFLSLVKQMPTNKYIRNILEWLAKNRTHGVKEEMKGNIFTTNTLLIRPILGPVVYITGKLIQKGILKKVNVKDI